MTTIEHFDKVIRRWSLELHPEVRESVMNEWEKCKKMLRVDRIASLVDSIMLAINTEQYETVKELRLELDAEIQEFGKEIKP